MLPQIVSQNLRGRVPRVERNACERRAARLRTTRGTRKPVRPRAQLGRVRKERFDARHAQLGDCSARPRSRRRSCAGWANRTRGQARSRSPAVRSRRPTAFAKARSTCRARTARYEDLLADADVDAIYVALPHPLHAEWAIKSLRAGKHVLCEKPFTVNYAAQAMAVAEAARAANRFVMEAFMYRCHPQTQAGSSS